MKKEYKHLNKVLVSKKALIHNHKELQRLHPNTAICPVLKSNAYGHGLTEVAQTFDELKVPFLIVDSLYEAYELYKLNVKTPILITGYTAPINFTVKPLPFEIAIFDIETALMLNKYQPLCNVHLFVDTGMNREGIQIENLQEFLDKLKKLTKLNIVGLCSHFADADNTTSQEFTEQQLTSYNEALKILEYNKIYPKWKHISASSGTFRDRDSNFNMIRAGLAHYGINPLAEDDSDTDKIDLHPALEFVSTLAQIKHVTKGALVGYNCTYKVKKDSVLGLLPAGYYEGVDRRLSNKGFVKIRDDFFPIVGRVSMNMTVIDIADLDKPKVGEEVIIYSSNPEDKNSLANSAKIAKTIPYELMVHIAESVKRKILS